MGMGHRNEPTKVSARQQIMVIGANVDIWNLAKEKPIKMNSATTKGLEVIPSIGIVIVK